MRTLLLSLATTVVLGFAEGEVARSQSHSWEFVRGDNPSECRLPTSSTAEELLSAAPVLPPGTEITTYHEVLAQVGHSHLRIDDAGAPRLPREFGTQSDVSFFEWGFEEGGSDYFFRVYIELSSSGSGTQIRALSLDQVTQTGGEWPDVCIWKLDS
jgi:hypothetical protein